jgi:hypothetical protein
MSVTQRLYKALSNYFTKDKPAKNAYLCDFDHVCHEIRIADVILVEGRNRISNIIKHVTFSPWSHSALYIGRLHDIEDPHIRERIHKHYQGKPNDQLVIESIVGQGTVVNCIGNYKDDHVRICRPLGLTHQDAQHVIARASENLGREYDVRQFLDLGRLFLRSMFIPPRFRSSLFNYKPGKATEDICSTMIAEAFMGVKFPILPLIRQDNKKIYEMIPRNPRLYTPSDFDYSPYFDIIKYPIFHIGQPAHYRNLPWNEGYYSNDEYGVKEMPPRHTEASKK